MLYNEIYLGPAGGSALLSPAGRKFRITPQELARTKRAASGKLIKEIYAVKNLFTLSYDLIDEQDSVHGSGLDTILGYYDLESELELKVQTRTSLDTYTVLMRPVARDRFRVVGNGLWSGVTVELDEV